LAATTGWSAGIPPKAAGYSEPELRPLSEIIEELTVVHPGLQRLTLRSRRPLQGGTLVPRVSPSARLGVLRLAGATLDNIGATLSTAAGAGRYVCRDSS
jgi:hypothetical protein